MNLLAVSVQLVLGIAVESTLSGLYVDNGVDQTVVQRAISREEKREVEEEILHLLGLPGRPRPRRRLLAGSAPKFLLDVYKSISESSSTRTTRSEFQLSGRDLHAIDESDVIMSFTSHSEKVARVRHERGKRLWFDVSEVPSDEGIVGAELRLYQTANYSFLNEENFVITIYTILDNDSEKELELVDSVKTRSEQEGWLMFNLTGPVTSWVLHPESNRGLYLSIHTDSNPGHEVLPEDLGLVTREGEEKEPFMVAFLRSSGLLPQQPSKSRTKRQTSRRRKKTTDTSYFKNPLMDKSTWQHSQISCQIQTLYVSFKDLDWQDWIIAPDGYGAFYCSGECNFPLNAHMNATNHAVVQTLVHLMNPLQVPKPCCAPTKLTAISVLYFFDESKVILKKYKNMVVKSCGCH